MQKKFIYVHIFEIFEKWILVHLLFLIISVLIPGRSTGNFALLKIHITHVDQLILSKPMHTRRRWVRKEEWIEERINP